MKIVEESKVTCFYKDLPIGSVFQSVITKDYYMKTNQDNGCDNYWAVNITDGMYCGRMVQFAFVDIVIPVKATLHIS